MTPPALLAYRSPHRITPVFDRDPDGFLDRWVCAHDGIRIHKEADAGWRHDAHEIAHLAKVERGEVVLAW